MPLHRSSRPPLGPGEDRRLPGPEVGQRVAGRGENLLEVLDVDGAEDAVSPVTPPAHPVAGGARPEASLPYPGGDAEQRPHDVRSHPDEGRHRKGDEQ